MTRIHALRTVNSLPTGLSLLLALLLLVAACQNPSATELTTDEQDALSGEIRRTLEEYGNAVKRKDLAAMLSFWSDTEDFVFAGDGTILGGYDQWAEVTTRDNNEAAQWLHLQMDNINIAILSSNAASATLTFDYSKITVAGDTVQARGAWTYVFKRFDTGWKVIQTNGTHLVYCNGAWRLATNCGGR